MGTTMPAMLSLPAPAPSISEHLLAAPVPVFVVPDSREAYGRLCQALAGQPTLRLADDRPSRAATAKTVTAMLLAAMYEAAGKTAGVTSTLGCSDGVEQIVRRPRAAGPGRIRPTGWAGWRITACDGRHPRNRQSRAGGATFWAGVELRRGDSDETCGGEHVARHGSQEKLFSAPSGGFSICSSPAGWRSSNLDDAKKPRDHRHAALCRAPPSACTWRPDITATVGRAARQASRRFLLRMGDEVLPVCTRMIGDQHVFQLPRRRPPLP